MTRFKATSNGPIPFTEEEELERDKEEAEWLAQSSIRAAIDVRKKREQLLSESDWMVSRYMETGVKLSDEWGAYRQSLRDIPQQPGFPENIIWPVPPF